MCTSQHPKIMKIRMCRVLPKWILKVTSPKGSRIILWSFWGILFLKFTVKMPPRPPRPQIRIFQDFPGFSIRIQLLADCEVLSATAFRNQWCQCAGRAEVHLPLRDRHRKRQKLPGWGCRPQEPIGFPQKTIETRKENPSFHRRWSGRLFLKFSRDFNTTRVIGIIFLIDLVVGLHRFTQPNTSRPRFSCVGHF